MAITKRSVKPPAADDHNQENGGENEDNPASEEQQREEQQQQQDLAMANHNGEEDVDEEEKSKSEAEDDIEKSEDEEEEEDDKESEDGEDEEKSEPKTGSQDFESDSDSDDDETSSEPETVVVKPIASKPMNGGAKSVPPKSSKKRVAEEEVGVDDDEKVMDMMMRNKKKKAKLLSNGKGEEAAAVTKSSAKRVWSEEDEVVLLNGLIEFRDERGKDANDDKQGFYEFIRGSVDVVDVKKMQISDKVRRLRQKYEAYAEKAKRGKKVVFPSPHEEELYEISKKVWGNEAKGEVSKDGSGDDEGAVSKKDSGNVGEVSKRGGEIEGASKRGVKKSGASYVGNNVIEDGDFAATYPDLYAELESEDSSLGARLLMKRSLSTIGHAKLKALDEEWKAAHVDEAKLLAKRSELTRKMALTATE